MVLGSCYFTLEGETGIIEVFSYLSEVMVAKNDFSKQLVNLALEPRNFPKEILVERAA